MSWFDDNFGELDFDRDAELVDYARDGRTTCRYCGRHGLHWVEDEQGWYLAEPDGYMHECNPDDVRRRDLEAFDNLDA